MEVESAPDAVNDVEDVSVGFAVDEVADDPAKDEDVEVVETLVADTVHEVLSVVFKEAEEVSTDDVGATDSDEVTVVETDAGSTAFMPAIIGGASRGIGPDGELTPAGIGSVGVSTGGVGAFAGGVGAFAGSFGAFAGSFDGSTGGSGAFAGSFGAFAGSFDGSTGESGSGTGVLGGLIGRVGDAELVLFVEDVLYPVDEDWKDVGDTELVLSAEVEVPYTEEEDEDTPEGARTRTVTAWLTDSVELGIVEVELKLADGVTQVDPAPSVVVEYTDGDEVAEGAIEDVELEDVIDVERSVCVSSRMNLSARRARTLLVVLVRLAVVELLVMIVVLVESVEEIGVAVDWRAVDVPLTPSDEVHDGSTVEVEPMPELVNVSSVVFIRAAIPRRDDPLRVVVGALSEETVGEVDMSNVELVYTKEEPDVVVVEFPGTLLVELKDVFDAWLDEVVAESPVSDSARAATGMLVSWTTFNMPASEVIATSTAVL